MPTAYLCPSPSEDFGSRRTRQVLSGAASNSGDRARSNIDLTPLSLRIPRIVAWVGSRAALPNHVPRLQNRSCLLPAIALPSDRSPSVRRNNDEVIAAQSLWILVGLTSLWERRPQGWVAHFR